MWKLRAEQKRPGREDRGRVGAPAANRMEGERDDTAAAESTTTGLE